MRLHVSPRRCTTTMPLVWEAGLVVLLRNGAVAALVAHVALDELGPVRGCGHEETLRDEHAPEARVGAQQQQDGEEHGKGGEHVRPGLLRVAEDEGGLAHKVDAVGCHRHPHRACGGAQALARQVGRGAHDLGSARGCQQHGRRHGRRGAEAAARRLRGDERRGRPALREYRDALAP